MKRKPTYLFAAAIFLGLISGFVQAQDDDPDPREMFTEAQEATQNQDFKKAVEILTKLNELRPNQPIVEFNLGYNLHATGNLDEAIKFHKKASVSDNFKPTALYNLACAYSLKEDQDKAFDYLKQSIEAGFRDMAQLNGDTDFKNIKTDGRFEEMRELIKNDGVMPVKLKAEDLYGDWKVESGMRSGSKVGSDRLPMIKISKESFTIPSGPDGPPFVMSYKLALDAKPMTVDFKIESGPVPEGTAKGIFKLGKDGEMTLCYEPKGEKRPEDYISTEENGFFVFKMKKAMKTEAKGKKMLASMMPGKWKCVKGTRAGAEVAAERMDSVITVDDKTITIPVGGDEAFVMSYTIDESQSPATIDMAIEKGPAPPGAKAIGIVKIEDGKFFLCYDSTGAKRPEEFNSTEENGFYYFEMKTAQE